MDELESRALIARVDAVLWEVWDPIGVNDCPDARDEYTGYAPKVARMLRSGTSDAEIERHLNWMAFDRMGLSLLDLEQTRRAVAALRDLLCGNDENA